MQRAEILLNDYNHYRFFTSSIRSKRAAGAYITGLKLTPGRLSAFSEMADWCEEHGIDPRRWLHSLFVARHWLFAPPLKHLKSQKHLKRYEAMEGSMPVYRERIAAEQHEIDDVAGRVFDSGRDISHTAETLKIRYARTGQPGRCMELMGTETFGFHPGSRVCGVCPLAIACGAMLQSRVSYDIQAVRRGEVTPQQARVMAAYGGGR